MTRTTFAAVPADAAALGVQVSAQPIGHGAEPHKIIAGSAGTAATGGRVNSQLFVQGAGIFEVQEKRT
jgi:hypothetical protein